MYSTENLTRCSFSWYLLMTVAVSAHDQRTAQLLAFSTRRGRLKLICGTKQVCFKAL